MPVEKDVFIRRWHWCEYRGLLPYPCLQAAKQTRWCYHFDVVIIRRSFCYSVYEGDENGARYKWLVWDWPLAGGKKQAQNWVIYRKKLLTPIG